MQKPTLEEYFESLDLKLLSMQNQNPTIEQVFEKAKAMRRAQTAEDFRADDCLDAEQAFDETFKAYESLIPKGIKHMALMAQQYALLIAQESKSFFEHTDNAAKLAKGGLSEEAMKAQEAAQEAQDEIRQALIMFEDVADISISPEQFVECYFADMKSFFETFDKEAGK